ncbi:polymer-forming cytoskeletal protein [Paenibacillus sp. R14(2021)]|uniref:bactofilin family protein n=1 Tax=Paenibacillus sp. R14(2021) TaxID=2859228 RepID=UPI001C61578B|nr:polymer-forming cytoskeletal protein [Paenibacillus sp. R14(2021)]
MFNWRRDKISTQLTDTFIGEGTIVEGPIRSSGSVRLEGQLRGDIFCEGDVTLGESAFAVSNITARNVYLAGQVTGNVRISGKLMITSSGKLYGDMDAATFVVEEGGVFQGNSAMDMGEPVMNPTQRRSGRDRRVAADPNWFGNERRTGYDRRNPEEAGFFQKKINYRGPEPASAGEAAEEAAVSREWDDAQGAASSTAAEPLRENGRTTMPSRHEAGELYAEGEPIRMDIPVAGEVGLELNDAVLDGYAPGAAAEKDHDAAADEPMAVIETEPAGSGPLYDKQQFAEAERAMKAAGNQPGIEVAPALETYAQHPVREQINEHEYLNNHEHEHINGLTYSGDQEQADAMDSAGSHAIKSEYEAVHASDDGIEASLEETKQADAHDGIAPETAAAAAIETLNEEAGGSEFADQLGVRTADIGDAAYEFAVDYDGDAAEDEIVSEFNGDAERELTSELDDDAAENNAMFFHEDEGSLGQKDETSFGQEVELMDASGFVRNEERKTAGSFSQKDELFDTSGPLPKVEQNTVKSAGSVYAYGFEEKTYANGSQHEQRTTSSAKAFNGRSAEDAAALLKNW